MPSEPSQAPEESTPPCPICGCSSAFEKQGGVVRCAECHAFNNAIYYINRQMKLKGRKWLERRIRSATRLLNYLKELEKLHG